MRNLQYEIRICQFQTHLKWVFLNQDLSVVREYQDRIKNTSSNLNVQIILVVIDGAKKDS